MNIHLQGTMDAISQLTARLDLKLTPADGSRGWRRRLEQARRDLKRLEHARTDPLSADAVHAARHELHSFFVQTYHIKDALKEDAGSTGVAPAQVESAIDRNPELALLADLANLDKHNRLTKPPRSGIVPQFGGPSGDTSGQASGWQLSLPIQHGPAQYRRSTVVRAGWATMRPFSSSARA